MDDVQHQIGACDTSIMGALLISFICGVGVWAL